MYSKSAGATDKGRLMSTNQDLVFADDAMGLYLVLDGMGGHQAGEVAAETASRAFVAHLRGEWTTIEQVLRDELPFDDAIQLVINAMHAANRDVYETARTRPDLAGMGTSMTALLIVGIRGVMVHVGATRLYLVRKGSIHRLSTDHTYAAEFARRGEFSMTDERRSELSRVLTRAVGVSPEVDVDSLVFDVLSKDSFLLVTDGLYRYLERDDELLPFFDEPLDKTPQLLIDMARGAGGKDNISVLVVDLERGEPSKAQSQVQVHDTAVRELLAAIRQSYLFRGLSLAQATHILNSGQRRSYDDGASLAEAGGACPGAFLVLAGRVAIVEGGREIAHIEPGESFGDISLVQTWTFRRSFVAEGATRVLYVDGGRFRNLTVRRPWLGVKLISRLTKALAAVVEPAVASQDEPTIPALGDATKWRLLP